MSTYYVDYEAGNDSNNGTSYALRKKLLSSFSPAAGDTVRVMASPAPTSLSQNATWTNASATVTLTTAVTTTISDCQTTWTASANITCTDNTTKFKESTKSQQIAIAVGFTTGLAAYFNTGTLDLSTKQQVSFKVMQTAGTVGAAGAVRLRLCTAIAGVTPVHDIPIPNLTALNQWVSVTVDLATNLNAAIASVSFDVVTDNGAQTFLIDDVIACKASSSADSLSLTSLIGYSDSTGAGGSNLETWYAIASINGTTIKLDNAVNTLPAALRGWSGRVRAIESSTNANPSVITATSHGLVTGDAIELQGHLLNTAINGSGLSVTVINANTFSVGVTGNGIGSATGGFWPTTQVRTTWKRETIKTAMATISTGVVQSVPASGSVGSPIVYSGGWNRTDMSTQTDETWFDGQNGLGFGISISSVSYVSTLKIAVTRYGNAGITLTGTCVGLIIDTPGSNNNTSSGMSHSSGITNVSITSVAFNNCGSLGSSVTATGKQYSSNINMNSNNIISGISSVPSNGHANIGTASNNGDYGIITGILGNVTVVGVCGNVSGGINSANKSNIRVSGVLANNDGLGILVGYNTVMTVNTYGNSNYGISNIEGDSKLINCYIGEAVKVGGMTAFNDAKIFSKNDQCIVGAFCIYGDGCNVASETSVVHTAGASWKVSPTSTNRASTYKFELTLARFTVIAGLTYTVKAWIRRTSTTTLNAGLLVRGGLINGVANDITVTASGAVNTWAQETLANFTPTESGVIELIGTCWDGTGTTESAYFDDVTVGNGASTVAITMDYNDFRNGPGPEPLANSAGGGILFF